MGRFLAAGLIVLGLVGAIFISAQESGKAQTVVPPPAVASPIPSRWTPEDYADFTEARIAALKAGLALRPDQQQAWGAFEKTLRDLAKQQNDRLALSGIQPAPPDPVAALRRRAGALSSAAASLKQLADAADPLYRNLDDSQKRRLAAMVAPGRR
jgi:hypothetical protein